jgi:hypothetical protein
MLVSVVDSVEHINRDSEVETNRQKKNLFWDLFWTMAQFVLVSIVECCWKRSRANTAAEQAWLLYVLYN